MALRIHHAEKFSTVPAAIIFDTDNTLYAYNPPHQVATEAVEKKAVKLLGVERDAFRNAFNSARQKVKKQLGPTASSHSRLLYYQQTIETLGLKTQLLLTLDLEQTYWRTFLSQAHLFPKVHNFISAVRNKGILTAVITDLTSQIQFRKLIYFGLDDEFDFVVTSEEVGKDKPAKAAFKLTLNKLGIEPASCWMIGDNPDEDILGASSMGITTLQKRHSGVVVYKGDKGPDLVFDDFTELYSKLVSWRWISEIEL